VTPLVTLEPHAAADYGALGVFLARYLANRAVAIPTELP